MTRIAVIALVPFAHEGAIVQPGTCVDVSPIVAAMLTYRQKARFATADDVVTEPEPIWEAPAPPPEPEKPTRKRRLPSKRRYRRRDLVADPS